MKGELVLPGVLLWELTAVLGRASTSVEPAQPGVYRQPLKCLPTKAQVQEPAQKRGKSLSQSLRTMELSESVSIVNCLEMSGDVVMMSRLSNFWW